MNFNYLAKEADTRYLQKNVILFYKFSHLLEKKITWLYIKKQINKEFTKVITGYYVFSPITRRKGLFTSNRPLELYRKRRLENLG